VDVIVRRARPSDIPGILLLIHKATGGEVQMKRADLLLALSERSYLIGQIDAEIKTIMGWNTSSTTAVAVDQIYTHPLEAVQVTGSPMLAEIERSARELICEVVLVYLEIDVRAPIAQLFLAAGYEPREREQMPRAWQETVAETQPPNTVILAKVLRDVRVK
jgi:N-acetylglutamate synthase-like GNAT family acetyltransferase